MTYFLNPKYGSELVSGEFVKASGLFDDLRHHLSIKGVLSGVINGRFFLANDGQTAQSAQFEQLADCPVLYGWNRPLNNLLVNGNVYMRILAGQIQI
ncbi:hypothetical protein [Paenibacillus donghaensis]|uniref:Uncharacterized protein n=1 Tax=Paenibacillus donghaensis TaxID=414771 RepID=A0A2Z2KWF9_9BACL|nr:hypothetical protein [Paenibacillus donghaensis]ASA25791.1 hypothetical protein B9T62_36735 [Paenibacillus donghaensis]